MYVSQRDIAQLDDNTLKRLVIAANQPGHGILAPLWHALGNAIIRAHRERAHVIAWAELELDDEEGELLPDVARPAEPAADDGPEVR